jgi:hypothetical protein
MLTPIRPATAASASTPDANRSAADPAGSDFASHLRTAASSSATSSPSGGGSKVSGGTSAPGTTSTPSTTPSASTGTPQPVLRPHGEKLQHVSGHHYARIADGPDRGMLLNQATGNPREGEAFRIVERNGRTFHVYGHGRSEVVEEVGKHGPATGGTSAATS